MMPQLNLSPASFAILRLRAISRRIMASISSGVSGAGSTPCAALWPSGSASALALFRVIDDRARRFCRDKHSVPVVEVRILVARLERRRQVGQGRRASGRTDRKRHQLLVLDERQTG